MRPAPARLSALLAVLALAALAPASAQEDAGDVDAGYEVRLARGDIPTTEPVEAADRWNLRIELVLAGGAQNVTLPLPAGFDVAGAGCTCANATAEQAADGVTVRVPAGAAAGSTAFLAATGPAGRVLALELPLPDAARPEDAFLAVYAPEGHAVDSDLDLAHMDCAEGDCELFFFESSAGAPLPTTLWLASHPAGAAVDPDPAPADGFDWRLALVLGLLAGIVLWALLVQRGVVQKRGRKQVAAEAPHDALAKEGKPTLEARKRALMAALKELEMAKMNQEVEVAAYDAVKADLKRQTVAVMRALEQAPA